MNWKSIKKKLRTPQIEALNLIDKYLKSNEQASCLIHMPTGSGKSGIISIVSNLIFQQCVLIVTPRVALTNQIYNDVKNEFFKIIKLNENPHDKQFHLLNNEKIFQKDINYDKYVFVTTIQKLNLLRTKDNAEFSKILEIVKLLIFDEGHYEPAYTWSETIRKFEIPKILFTATPFRNDIKPFEISESFIFPYKYNQGIEDGYLRKVEFLECGKFQNDADFLEKVIKYYKKTFGNFSKNSPKLIIRCSMRSTIRRLGKLLLDKYPKNYIIAIHERFDSKDEVFVNSVPKNIKSHSAKIWIHQYKLMEGIDDNQFRMLAIYDKFGNERSLIQQIGRLVRRTSKSDEVAYVLDFENNYHKNIWKKYLVFDNNLDIHSFKPMSNKVLESFYKIGNDYEYVLDGFKTKFNLNLDLKPDDFNIPLQVNLIKKYSSFEVLKFIEFIKQKLGKEDKRYKIQSHEIDDNMVYTIVYVNISSSPFLTDKYALNIKHEIMIIWELDNLLCFFDSSGFLPINETEMGLSTAQDMNLLKKVFNKNNKSVVNMVSLQNSNLGTNSIRNRRISANSIDNTISYLDDNAQIILSISGKHLEIQNIEDKKSVKIINRYVGMTKGRLSQRGEWYSLVNYVLWIKELYKTMNQSNIKPQPVFSRYSQQIEDISLPKPKHILLDIEEIESEFVFSKSISGKQKILKKGSELLLEDVSALIEENTNSEIHTNQYFFEVTILDNIKEKIYISYNIEKRNYILSGDDFDSLFEPKVNSQYKTILDFLNKRQSFKIIPEEPNVIYAYGNFYKTNIEYGKNFDSSEYFLNPLLITVNQLDKIESEKGINKTRNNGDSWVSDSIFGLIDDLGKGTELKKYIKSPELIVFDDMNTEIADVILGYDSNKNTRKIVFIHAKCGNGSKYSASALQEVCSQATKNIKFLNMFNKLTPPNLPKWDSPWKSKGLQVDRRIRKPKKINGIEAWKRISKIIQDPLSEKEVWLILGKTLSKKSLFKELSNGTYEAIQASLLLHSTLQSVGSVNSNLRIFCSK